MFPIALRVPAAAFFVAAGALATFAGYRMFRTVLGIYGFVLGALAATAIIGAEETLYFVIAALIGGILGALILIGAYFVGVALLGAGLGALAVNLIWSQIGRDPHALIVIVAAVIGALGALALQRYVIIIGTAFAGASTMLLGILELSGHPAAAAAAERSDIIVVYPIPTVGANRWLVLAWLLLGSAGVVVQLAYTAKGKKNP
ncbi:MAG: DUF4203 domain-containing protein [Vicinamibacterales bacterium]